MCNAFSCICPEVGEVVWKLGMDSHAELIKKVGFRDDTNNPQNMTFAKIEITPDNKDYRKPDKWTLHIDETITPTWWNKAYEAACWDAHKEWCNQLYKILDTKKEIVNPFTKIKPPKKILKKHIKMLQRSASVGDSVGASVWASVWASVRASVWASVGSLFDIPRDQWKHCEKLTGQGYPFQDSVDLWNLGLVPSFDGKVWRLHGGPKAEVLFEIGAKELKEYK